MATPLLHTWVSAPINKLTSYALSAFRSHIHKLIDRLTNYILKRLVNGWVLGTSWQGERRRSLWSLNCMGSPHICALRDSEHSPSLW